MEFLLDLLQGAGIAAAVGIRPALPVLLVGALATADLGVDFGGTDFAFLESWPFLLGALVLVVALDLAFRRTGEPGARGPVFVGLLGLALVLGGLLGAASMADRDHSVVAGAVAGVAAAALGAVAARALFDRVRRRLDADTARTLPVYGEGAALAAAGASVLAPPLALVVIGGLAWLLAGSRRQAEKKYAGLRILR